MAEMEFKHHVSEISSGAPLPETYQRKVGGEVRGTPDVQSAASNYAASTNWMSAIGSEVATRSSNAIAAKLGSELGKNPQGDLFPSFTEFDKEFERSYTTQSHSVLSVQAQKLITQSNLELAASPRLDAGMLAKVQKQTYSGLQNIYSLAPQSIRPQLEQQYDSVMIQQNSQLTSRMLSEQRIDRKNNIDLSTKVNSQNAHSLAMDGVGLDKNGDSLPALSSVKSIQSAYSAAVANRDATPLEAKVAVDSARQAYLSGKYTRLARIAEQEKKLPAFYKWLADNPPSDIKDEDRSAVINNVVEFMNQQASLKIQDQQLKMSEFSVKLAENPDKISGVEFAQLQSQLTPLQAQKVKLDLVQALSKRRTENFQSSVIMADWGNSQLHARVGDKERNQAFDTLVQKVVSNSTSSGNPPVSIEMAEVQIAASSGAPVQVFTKSIQDKLSSGNPALMELAAQQMHSLYQMNAGHALSGLNERDKAAYGAYETMRSSLQPTDAARETINKVYNQDPIMFTANQQKWSNFVSTASRDIPLSDFALQRFGYSKNDFLTPTVSQIYATDMLEKYSTNYQLLGGDEVTARRVTQRYIDENYGDTGVNGGSNKTLHPLEKILGYSSSDVVPFIQQDIINTLNEKFIPIKESYLKGQASEYWETEQLTGKKHGIFSTSFDPVKVKRHSKKDGKEKVDVFDVVVQGNSFDDWDVSVYSEESGLRNLYQIAPYNGVISYRPNKKSIDESYLKASGK